MITQYLQEILYHGVLNDKGLAGKWEPSFFDSKVMQLCFGCAKKYLMEYDEAPSLSQLKEILRLEGKLEECDEMLINMLYGAKEHLAEYTDEWIYDTATSYGELKHFMNALEKTVRFVKTSGNDITVDDAKEFVEKAKSIFKDGSNVIFGVDDSIGSDFWDAASHKQNKLKRSPSGYPFIDHCLGGGYFPGILMVLLGAPKIGKSLWLQNLCAKSVMNGENNLYISLELPEEMIHSRIGSNIFNLPSGEYFKYSEDTDSFKNHMNSVVNGCMVRPGALHVKSFPTSTLTTIELESYVLKEEERRSLPGAPFKFKNIFVDYINIMQNWRNKNSENTYLKIKQIAEDLKAVGLANGWAIITATQTKRMDNTREDITDVDVSESYALGATVDAMFGIISTPIMKSQGKYYLKCIYDRVAPEDNKRKLFINDIMHLRITEDPDTQIEDVSDAYLLNMTQRPQYNSSKVMRGRGDRNRKADSQPEYPNINLNDTTIPPNTMFDTPKLTMKPVVTNADMSSGPIPQSNPVDMTQSFLFSNADLYKNKYDGEYLDDNYDH